MSRDPLFFPFLSTSSFSPSFSRASRFQTVVIPVFTHDQRNSRKQISSSARSASTQPPHSNPGFPSKMNFERGRSQLPETRTERSRPTTSTSFKIPGVKPRSSEGVSVKAERDTNSNSEQRLENLTHSNSQVLAREDSNPSFDKSNSRTNSLTTATEIQSRTTTATHSRIRTAQSRPQTGLSHQTGPEGSYVCAVLEHRGVGHEVGIAVMEKETGE